VDLEYTVEEKPSDRLELSGGWGAGRLVLSLGLSFTNFSLRNTFNKNAWSPLPSGDGQTLNLRAQTNGAFFQSYSLSFVEPWLGGRKPNALSFSAYYIPCRPTARTSSSTPPTAAWPIRCGNRCSSPVRSSVWASAHLAGRLLHCCGRPWATRTTTCATTDSGAVVFDFTNGVSNVLSYQFQFRATRLISPSSRVRVPTSTFSVKATPPYSCSNPGVIGPLPAAQRYQWAEFHKWKFTTQWFNKLTNSKSGHDLVLMTRAGFGFLGRYNNAGQFPFERFYLGGAALTGFQLDGREIVGLAWLR
jgi:outer membrane protein insertion porin family